MNFWRRWHLNLKERLVESKVKKFSLSFCESTFLHFYLPADLETIFNILCTHRLLHLFPHGKHDSLK